MGSTPSKPMVPVSNGVHRRPLSLRSNFSWTLTGNLATVVAQFGVLSALARLGDVEMVGQYGLGLSLTAPIFLLASMSLRTILVTDVEGAHSFSRYFTLRLIGMTGGFAIVCLAVVILNYQFETALVVITVAAGRFFEGSSDMIYGAFHKAELMDTIAKSMIARSTSCFIIFTISLIAFESLVISAASTILVSLGFLLLYDARNLLKLHSYSWSNNTWMGHGYFTASWSTCRDWRSLVPLVVVCLPAGLASSLVSLNTNVPRYVLEKFDGSTALGIFTLIAYPLVAGNTVISALSHSSLPRLSRHFRHGESKSFFRILSKLIAIATILAILAFAAAFLFGEPLLRLAFGDIYATQHSAFLVLVLGMGVGFINWFLNSALHAMRKFKLVLSIQIVMLAVILVGALAFVPPFGLLGASWLLTISMLLQVLVKGVLVKFGVSWTNSCANTGRN